MLFRSGWTLMYWDDWEEKGGNTPGWETQESGAERWKGHLAGWAGPEGLASEGKKADRGHLFLLRGSGTQPGSPSSQNQCPNCVGSTRPGDSMTPVLTTTLALTFTSASSHRPTLEMQHSSKQTLPDPNQYICGLICLLFCKKKLRLRQSGTWDPLLQ